MCKGGYQILDLRDTNLTSSPVVIKGLIKTISSSHDKPLLVCGIKINGANYNNIFTGVNPAQGGRYTIPLYNGVLTITGGGGGDSVTYTQNA